MLKQLWGIVLFLLGYICHLSLSRPCVFTSPSPHCSSATFNLQPLTVSGNSFSYLIVDGDIPCTPEHEEVYDYVWNICAPVTSSSYPDYCPKVSATVLQYKEKDNGFKECHVLGKMPLSESDYKYSLIDMMDPTKGVRVTYPHSGDPCRSTHTNRTAAIDIICKNTRATIISAYEEPKCTYHLTINSYYGCPTECPITSNGLCNSHGHCHYDRKAKAPYCYCNEGWGGSACDQQGASSSSSSSSSGGKSSTKSSTGVSMQIGLLIGLLILTVLLIGIVGFMVVKINEYRKEQFEKEEMSSHHNTEMVTF